MAVKGELDAQKLRVWLQSNGSDIDVPEGLKNARLGPLWSFLGVAKAKEVDGVDERAKVANCKTSIFSSNEASEQLKQIQVRAPASSFPDFLVLRHLNLTRGIMATLQGNTDNLNGQVSHLHSEGENLQAKVTTSFGGEVHNICVVLLTTYGTFIEA